MLRYQASEVNNINSFSIPITQPRVLNIDTIESVVDHYGFCSIVCLFLSFFVCLCFTSLQQRGHLETAPPFTVPCEGREAR